MTKKFYLPLILLIAVQLSYGQHIALTFQDAEKQGISMKHLESIYKNALHVDSSQAVFKTEKQQTEMQSAYTKLLQDYGKFLLDHNFNWEKQTRGFNRIYFNKDGTIDYFLYYFPTNNLKPEDQLSAEKQAEFNRLLNLFIKDYKISMSATVNFAQCSPTVYMPKE
jgi:hypothetical protein